MNLAALSHLNIWWIGELIDALLRPSFVRWKSAERNNQPAATKRHELIFLMLLNQVDCSPYLIVSDRCGLWILTGKAADDCREQMRWEDES